MCVMAYDELYHFLPPLETKTMSKPWDALASEILTTLKDGAKDFIDETKPELQDFMKDRAEDIAREKWTSINGTGEERLLAESNLLHLYAQVKGEIIRLDYVTTGRAQAMLLKVFEIVISTVQKVLLPSLLSE